MSHEIEDVKHAKEILVDLHNDKFPSLGQHLIAMTEELDSDVLRRLSNLRGDAFMYVAVNGTYVTVSVVDDTYVRAVNRRIAEYQEWAEEQGIAEEWTPKHTQDMAEDELLGHALFADHLSYKVKMY